jgi:hypothetical protein
VPRFRRCRCDMSHNIQRREFASRNNASKPSRKSLPRATTTACRSSTLLALSPATAPLSRRSGRRPRQETAAPRWSRSRQRQVDTRIIATDAMRQCGSYRADWLQNIISMPDLWVSCAEPQRTVSGEVSFSTFQTQPGRASRRCRRSSFILSFFRL